MLNQIQIYFRSYPVPYFPSRMLSLYHNTVRMINVRLSENYFIIFKMYKNYVLFVFAI